MRYATTFADFMINRIPYFDTVKLKSYRESAFIRFIFIRHVLLPSKSPPFFFLKIYFWWWKKLFQLENYIFQDSFFLKFNVNVLTSCIGGTNDQNTKYIFDKNPELIDKNAFYLIHFNFLEILFLLFEIEKHF